jgi:hypothetical protein
MRPRFALIYGLVIVSAIIFFTLQIVIIDNVFPYWAYFHDPFDYMEQSKASLFSADFYAPLPNDVFNPRPFTVSIFLKMVGQNFTYFVYLQKYIYCIACIIFVLSFGRLLSGYVLKIVFQLALLFFFTWWNIVGWSELPISESISMSFLLLWLSVIFFFLKKRTVLTVILLVLTSILFSFTRDTWSYIVLAFFAFNLFFFTDKRKGLVLNISLFVFVVLLFTFQAYTIKRGERTVLPVFNSITGRISKNQEYVNWFKKQGMPCDTQLVKDFRELPFSDRASYAKIYAAYGDSAYKPLFNWIKKEGRSAYQKFILTHPSYFLLQDQTPAERDRILVYNIPYYYGRTHDFFANASNVFPLFPSVVTILLALGSAFLYFRNKKKIYFLPLLLVFLTLVHAMISYNADTMEVERHMIYTCICKELISIMTLALFCSYAVRILRVRKRKSEGNSSTATG